MVHSETVRLKLFFFFLEESFSNNDKGFIVTGKSSTYHFDDIWELHPYELVLKRFNAHSDFSVSKEEVLQRLPANFDFARKQIPK